VAPNDNSTAFILYKTYTYIIVSNKLIKCIVFSHGPYYRSFATWLPAKDFFVCVKVFVPVSAHTSAPPFPTRSRIRWSRDRSAYRGTRHENTAHVTKLKPKKNGTTNTLKHTAKHIVFWCTYTYIQYVSVCVCVCAFI